MMADISGSNSDQEWLTIPELKTFDGGDVTFYLYAASSCDDDM
jgi:hypothetical protein